MLTALLLAMVAQQPPQVTLPPRAAQVTLPDRPVQHIPHDPAPVPEPLPAPLEPSPGGPAGPAASSRQDTPPPAQEAPPAPRLAQAEKSSPAPRGGYLPPDPNATNRVGPDTGVAPQPRGSANQQPVYASPQASEVPFQDGQRVQFVNPNTYIKGEIGTVVEVRGSSYRVRFDTGYERWCTQRDLVASPQQPVTAVPQSPYGAYQAPPASWPMYYATTPTFAQPYYVQQSYAAPVVDYYGSTLYGAGGACANGQCGAPGMGFGFHPFRAIGSALFR